MNYNRDAETRKAYQPATTDQDKRFLSWELEPGEHLLEKAGLVEELRRWDALDRLLRHGISIRTLVGFMLMRDECIGKDKSRDGAG